MRSALAARYLSNAISSPVTPSVMGVGPGALATNGSSFPFFASEFVMNPTVANGLESVHPQMLRMASPVDPQRLGADARREIGQCFEWALDEVRMEKKDAAARMGYTDQGVIGRWISGIERIQNDKVMLCLPTVWPHYLIAQLRTCSGVEVKTQVTLARTA